MESILEIQRSLHEERERTIAAMVVENLEKKTSHRDQVLFNTVGVGYYGTVVPWLAENEVIAHFKA